MPTWEVTVTEKRIYRVKVQAESWTDAHSAAIDSTDELEHDDTYYCADVQRQLGEPWLRRGGWYDLHGPGDVVVCERAYGHRFTACDIALLRHRLGQLGLVVVDRWNGENCSTVSFKCTGRVGTDPFTEEQRSLLCEPRPWPTST